MSLRVTAEMLDGTIYGLWFVRVFARIFSNLKHKTEKIKLKTDPRATHNDIKFGLFGWIPLKLIAVKEISFTSDIVNTTWHRNIWKTRTAMLSTEKAVTCTIQNASWEATGTLTMIILYFFALWNIFFMKKGVQDNINDSVSKKKKE